MSFEYRVFFKCEDVIGLTELLRDLGWRDDELDEVRDDEYLNLHNDDIGVKKRAGKKWEIKLKLKELDSIEYYVKHKLGKKDDFFHHYLGQVSTLMKEYGIESPLGSSGEVIKISKRRQKSGSLELCRLVAVTSSSCETTWVSLAIECDSFEQVQEELRQEKYAPLFRLLAQDSGVIIGGYPKFVRIAF